jgi:pilus assembly protein CpaE
MQQATKGNAPAFMAFAKDSADVQTLKEFAQAQQLNVDLVLQGDIVTAIEYLGKHPSPLVLLVELPSASEAADLLDKLADVCNEDTKVITIGEINEYSFYCWLMDIGISSYLLRPLTLKMLETAYQRTVVGSQAGAAQERKPAIVIAMLGARGGVGVSTLALNLAGLIAEFGHKKVALVDLDPQEGTLSLQLDIEPARGLRDALEKPDRIDSMFIDRVLTKPHPNLNVISAEEALKEVVHFSEYAADALLREVTEKFDVVVLDVPRHLNEFTKEALRKATHILLVGEPSLQSLRDVLRLGDLLRDTIKAKPPGLVINRTHLAAKHEMSVADFEKAVAMESLARIPFAADIYMPISTNIPAVEHHTHAAVLPLLELAKQLVPGLELPGADGAASFFDKLKKRFAKPAPAGEHSGKE